MELRAVFQGQWVANAQEMAIFDPVFEVPHRRGAYLFRLVPVCLAL